MGNETWAGAMAIAAIAMACAIYYTATSWFEHRERMAKIQQGIDPATGKPLQKEVPK